MIDQPISISRNEGSEVVLPYPDWKGVIDRGTCATVSCGSISFPGSTASVFANYKQGSPNWYGSLTEGQTDASGFQYKRNRYYDSKSGTFTQEDPIGLAGGMNLYGYADGDPINFSDPFGLSADCNFKTGAGCSEGYKRQLAQDKPLESAENPLEYASLAGVGKKVVTKGIVKATSKLNVSVRGTREYAKDLFREHAGDDALEVMRDRGTKRIVGVRTEDGRAIWRPKKGKDGVTANVEVIDDQGTRVNVHVRP